MINIIANLIVLACVFAIFMAVLVDFVEFHHKAGVKKNKKSSVETGGMILFFLGFYSLLRFDIGRFDISSSLFQYFFIMLGLLLLIFGCYINIRGRFFLGKNWANQIKIYQDHKFISSGPYRFVRHPLYASIIWMFFGACLVYCNYLTLLSTIFIFIPFMYLRAKQEEKLLSQEFAEYKNYQKKVGLFFPKF